MPAKRGDTATSRVVEGGRRAAPDSGAAGSGGGGGTVTRQTPVKTQRPLSYRRPKTPHIEERRRQQFPNNASSAPVGGGDGGRWTGARQVAAENPRQSVAAGKVSNAGVSAAEHATAVQTYRQDQQADGDLAARAAAPEQRPPQQQRHGNLVDERSVLEPMQLDETGGRAHGVSPRHRIPPPPSAQACGGQVPLARGSDDRQAVRLRTGNRAPELTAPKTDEPPHARRSFVKKFSPDEDEGVPVSEHMNNAAAPEENEVARLRRAKREAGTAATTQAAAMRDYGTSRENEDKSPRVGSRLWESSRTQEVEAAAAEKAERQRETAAELAVHLISAHREDVRSALAAARKDMDLVSKADQDRHPSALLAYAREVEGVLGTRLAAGAKLRAALDSYVALRQASSSPRKSETGMGVGGVRTHGRAVQT